MNWKEELKQMKLQELQRKFPAAYQASGGEDYILKPISDKTANGLTKCIIDWITLKGGYANRINTQGQARVHKVPRYNILTGKTEYRDSVQWTPSTTRIGTPDIDAIIHGKAVKIEVKIGKDKLSEAQKKHLEDIAKAGGLYFVAKDMESFINWYKLNFEHEQNHSR
jgi:hypothetical protein